MNNPHEKTGISGRGRLWRDGANQASDALILLDVNGTKHMVAIKRPSGHWAMPGGFRESMDGYLEDARKAAFRELLEETGLKLKKDEGVLAYSGYVLDPRNTDDAWIETSVYFLDLGRVDQLPYVRGADDATEARLLPLTTETLAQLCPGHAKIVQDVLLQRGIAMCSTCTQELLEKAILDIDVTDPSLFTQVISAICTTAIQDASAIHAHPNYLVRVALLFRLFYDAAGFVFDRVSLKLSLDERILVETVFQRFLRTHQALRDPKFLDKALDNLPETYREIAESTIVSGNGSLN